MSFFNRGLDEEFVDALNEEYDRDEKGWWRQLVDDADTFVAIRDNYVNVYYRGCNLLKLWQDQTKAVVGEIHYKYLLRPDVTPEPEYVRVVDGKAKRRDTNYFFDDVSDIASLKKAVKPYAGKEKKGVHEVILANPNVIDVEIAFQKDEDRAGAPRLDFAALRCAGEDTKIVFFEAKHFDNQELRAKVGDPKVVKQMQEYSKILREKYCAVAESYRRVCCDLSRLHGVSEQKQNEMLKSVVAGSALEVDTEPVLVVFGFDRDQKDGAIWRPHREKLERKLSKERFHLKGDSKDFRSGISP